MANINKIRLSGTTYNLQDSNATKTVELTQAQYDALSVKDPNTFYIITDAQGADLSQYYTSAQTESAITQAVSGKVDNSTYTAYTAATDSALANKLATSDFNTYSGTVDTTLSGKLDTSTFDTYSGSVETALSGKQDTLSAGTGIDITDNVISATGGGGTSYTAGTGIDITNDVISVTGMVDTTTFNTYSGSVDTALSGKQDTLSAGTGIEISGNVISATGGGGGGITIDPSLDSGSTNPVANSAITKTLYTAANANGDGNGYVGNIEAKNDSTYLGRLIWGFTATRYKRPLGGSANNNSQGVSFYCSSINGVRTVSKDYKNVGHFSLIETSAITSSVTSSSTDVQVPSAKAVNDKLGGLNLVKLTQTEYDALTTKDDNTVYFIGDSTNGYTMKIGSANVN